MQSDDNNIAPVDNTADSSANAAPTGTPTEGRTVPGNSAQPTTPPVDDLKDRIDRLAGEQAPDITPEEFARLQRSGSLHIDAQGRVRANRREDTDPGLSLRKRRAWYIN